MSNLEIETQNIQNGCNVSANLIDQNVSPVNKPDEKSLSE